MDASAGFDPEAKEAALRAEAAAWDTSAPVLAGPDDVPVIDVGPWFARGDRRELDRAATQLRRASEEVGFQQLVGHGLPLELTTAVLDAARRFHGLPATEKNAIGMDRPAWPLRGVGYLPFGARKLPRRDRGNLNEAFVVKGDDETTFADNQWPPEAALQGFRAIVEAYVGAITGLARRLLPVYAVALELDPGFFEPAFESPFWRLRLTHYPAPEPSVAGHGIEPHVDTTFFTLLLQDSPGLVIYSDRRARWIRVPAQPDALVVNSGELLRQWSNDRFQSTRHFAVNPGPGSRFSVPFFFNTTADYVMECLPSCHGPGNPPRYPPVSYRTSQAAAQGE